MSLPNLIGNGFNSIETNGSGTVIVASDLDKLYVSSNSGTSFNTYNLSGCLQITTNEPGDIAYACTASNIYVCTNMSSPNWQIASAFSAITGKTWTSIQVGSYSNGTTYCMVAGSTSGIFGIITTSGSNAVILDGGGTKNWKTITISRGIITGVPTWCGISNTVIYTRILSSNTSANNFNTVSSINKICLYQRGAVSRLFYTTTTQNDSIYYYNSLVAAEVSNTISNSSVNGVTGSSGIWNNIAVSYGSTGNYSLLFSSNISARLYYISNASQTPITGTITSLYTAKIYTSVSLMVNTILYATNSTDIYISNDSGSTWRIATQQPKTPLFIKNIYSMSFLTGL